MKRKSVLAWGLAILLIIGSVNIPVGANLVNAADYYTVTFKTEYGKIVKNDSTEYIVKVENGDNLGDWTFCNNIKGKVFMGWSVPGYDDPIYTDELASYIPTSDVTINAVWKDVSYIELDAAGGSIEGGKDYCNIDDNLQTSYREGYIFEGWFDADGYELDFTDNIVSGTKYYAHYTEAVTITFDADGGLFYNSFSSYDESVRKGVKDYYSPIIPYKDGAAFAGWRINGEGDILSNNDVINYVFYDNTRLVAVWKASVQITLDANGGEFWSSGGTTKTEQVALGEKNAISFETPDKDGMAFCGWSLNGSYIDVEDYIFTTPVTLKAIWKETVELTFDFNGGKNESGYTDEKYTVNKGEKSYAWPEEPTKPGYALTGWKKSGDSKLYSSEEIYESAFNSDTVFVAQWTEGVKVTFYSSEGYISGVEKRTSKKLYIPKGSYLSSIIQASDHKGKCFLGWSLTKGSDQVDFEYEYNKPINNDINFYAVWTDGVTVTFDPNGGYWHDDDDGVLEVYAEKGDTLKNRIIGINNPITDVSGRYFIGWKKKNSEDTKLYNKYEVTNDISYNEDTDFEAQWEDDGVDVTFYSPYGYMDGRNADSKYYTATVSPNAKISDCLENYPSVWMEGYRTDYWTRDNDDTHYTTDEMLALTITQDTTFTVHLKKLINVNFDANGGTIAYGPGTHSSITRYCDLDEIIRFSWYTPKRNGYTFTGWTVKNGPTSKIYSNNETFTIKGEITFVANWKINTSGGNSGSKGSSTPKPTSNTKKTTTPKKTPPKYSNEWINGKWYNKDGSQTYKGTMSWKSNSKGWWIEDSAGWYPTSTWQKIDGTWYFFKPDGYMASNEYYNGYWFNSDGSWDSQYYLTWKSNSQGWWVEDKSGWWPANMWLKIDGDWYYFNGSGYMVTSQYVDGYWVGANGVCQ